MKFLSLLVAVIIQQALSQDVTTTSVPNVVTTVKVAAPTTAALKVAAPPPKRTPIVRSFVESNDTVSEMMKPFFDCRREGHYCDPEGGSCDIDTGFCVCNENFMGFLCDHTLDNIVNVSECNDGQGCGSDEEAICLATTEADVTSKNCSCPYHLSGIACEQPRFELRCSEDFLTLKVSAYSSTTTVYVIDHAKSSRIDDALCRFNGTDEKVLRLMYHDLVEVCGGISPENNTYELRFIIQSDALWLTSFDQVTTARCSVNITHEYQKSIVVDAGVATGVRQLYPGIPVVGAAALVSNDLGNVAAESIMAERRKVEWINVAPKPVITLGREVDNAIVPVNDSVKIGEIIAFTIENVNDTFFNAIRGEECTLKMDDAITAPLIKDVCPASRLAATLLIWSKTLVTEKTVSYFLRLPANALAGQPRQITINCKVKMCADEKLPECAFPEDSCKSVLTRVFTRSRREAASNEGTAFAYVKTSFDIDYEENAKSSAAILKLSPIVIFIFISKMFF